MSAADDDFSTESARRAARDDRLGDWVTDFLASPGSDNAELAKGLAEQPLRWIGPVELLFDQLNRLAGPPGHPVLQPVPEDEWRDDVDELAGHIDGGHEPPPVVVTYDDGDLVLEDGNHRVEAMRRAGLNRVWAVIGFRSDEERDAFLERSDASHL